MSPKRAVTLQDVADHAGVSRGAASFALTGRNGVSEATRERVRASAEALGYRPNLSARNLRAARTGVIAVYLPAVAPTLSYYAEATFGIVNEAMAAGLVVTLVPSPAPGTILPRLRADGLIAIDPAPGDPALEQLLSAGMPVVSGEEMPAEYRRVRGEVRSDHTAATLRLLDHFHANGAKAPAVISPEGSLGWAEEVTTAYRAWCAEHGIKERVEVVRLDSLPESTVAATETLLGARDPADAILALTEGSVLNVLTSATEYGRSAGNDLLVAAAVDSPALQFTEPTITAIDLNPREFGRACMRIMLDVLEDRASTSEVVRHNVPIEINFRDSTRGKRV
ncbi:MAG: LacI family transcriptional regulator [Actinobacteria bacterium]|nr:LacI family transcriptional regulator [Actinomycetota bacterium]